MKKFLPLFAIFIVLISGCKNTQRIRTVESLPQRLYSRDSVTFYNKGRNTNFPPALYVDFEVFFFRLEEEGCPEDFGGMYLDDDLNHFVIYTTDLSDSSKTFYESLVYQRIVEANPVEYRIVECDYSLRELRTTYQELINLDMPWVNSIRLNVQFNRIELCVDKWDRDLEKQTAALIEHPEHCCIRVTTNESNPVTFLDPEEDYETFMEYVDPSRTDVELQIMQQLCNIRYLYQDDDWQFIQLQSINVSVMGNGISIYRCDITGELLYEEWNDVNESFFRNVLYDMTDPIYIYVTNTSRAFVV